MVALSKIPEKTKTCFCKTLLVQTLYQMVANILYLMNHYLVFELNVNFQVDNFS